MTSPLSTTRKVTPLLAAVGISIALAGCGNSGEPESTSSPAAAPSQTHSTSAATSAAPAAYDISRVDNVKDDFPPGFTVNPEATKTLAQHDIDSSGVNAFTKAQVDPAQCRSLLIPSYAEPSVGAQAAGIRAEGDQGNMYVVALGLPNPVPVSSPPAECDHATISGSEQAAGTAERIPAPQIDGVTTNATKLSADNEEDPDYIFSAALNDQTSVVVMGSTDPSLNPQQFMSDLLVKAVAAVRGQ